MKKKIFLAGNSSWYVYNFKTGLINALQDAGFDVVIGAAPDDYTGKLTRPFYPLPVNAKGVNPIEDMRLLRRLTKLYCEEVKPAVALHFTSKLNIYGAFAARRAGIPCINNISGLGSAIIKDGIVTRIVKMLYRRSQKHASVLLFQNRDDLEYFRTAGIIKENRYDFVPGSGVNLGEFTPTPRQDSTNDGGNFSFLLIARMLRDKGVYEYVKAARALHTRYPHAVFKLLGPLDVDNPTAISRAEMDSWIAEGIVEYLGVRDDVRGDLSAADCVVLPSYREGTPRTLLEAAAMAKPIVATDVPGCREVVVHEENGLLCRVKDGEDLTRKMEQMLALEADRRQEMGRRGRRLMEERFDERIVFDKYIELVKELK